MDKFIEMYNLLRLEILFQEATANTNKTMTSDGIESVILKKPLKKQKSKMASQVNSTKHLKKS